MDQNTVPAHDATFNREDNADHDHDSSDTTLSRLSQTKFMQENPDAHVPLPIGSSGRTNQRSILDDQAKCRDLD